MPTVRQRHSITETDELAQALERAARRWPDASKAQLVVRLAMEADKAQKAKDEDNRRRRVEAVRSLAGTFTGRYPPGYLAELRDHDW